MTHVESIAATILRKHRLSAPVDLAPILEHEGLEVLHFPFAGRVHEVIAGSVIGIKSGVSNPRYIRELVAHALGHHFLHAGNQLFCMNRTDLVDRLVEEREAQAFAASLLVPQDELTYWMRRETDIGCLADYFAVTEPFLAQIISLRRV